MEKKQFIKPLVTIAVIAIIVGVYLLFNWEEIQPRDLEADRRAAFENTRNDYISLLNDNKEDFEYAAEIMGQWSKGNIYFGDFNDRITGNMKFDSYISCNNKEIIDELSNNQKFYNHVFNIYSLAEIALVNAEEDYISFVINNPPAGCRGSLRYYKNGIDDYLSAGVLQKIDDHWGITIVGNV